MVLVCEDRHHFCFEVMSKVFENTGKRIIIYSDDGAFRLIANRRAISEDHHGVIKYYGSEWFIETHKRDGHGFVPFRFSGLRYNVRKKQEIIDMLSRSVRFTQAYAELKG